MSAIDNTKQVIVYYPNWNLGELEADKGGEVGSIAWEAVTMVNHAFFTVYPDGDSTESSFERRENGLAARTSFKCVSTLPEADFVDQKKSAYNDSPRNHFAQYEIYAHKYPDVKIMISVGGWTNSGFFSEMAYTQEGRNSFIDSLVDLMRKYPFIVGIDIDWEYPAGSTDGDRMPENENDEGCPIWDSPKSDNTNFALLLKEMRERFDTEFGVGEKMITACASSSTGWTLPMQQWENFEPYLDYINIMTYDLTGTWAGVTAHHTPLDLTESAVEYFITKGIVPAKLNIGSPMYPMWFKMSGDTIPETIVGAPIDANAVMPAKFLDTTAMQMLEKDGEGGWIMGFDEAAGASYLYNAKINSHYYMWFVTYENLRSLQLKIDMINRMDLAGIIVWESSQDTEDHLMINYMNDGLNKE